MINNSYIRWEKVKYSRTQIIKAGKTIRKDINEVPNDEYKNALTIVDNWRVSHAYPLHVFYLNIKRLASENKEIIVAQRLKRLNSIINKLKREHSMSLWTVQDLGGCRMIVPTVGDVYSYSDRFRNSRMRHIFDKENDYIKTPQLSGYRSLHLIYLYHSDKSEIFNNMKIEIQFRTKLQHIWATAVESMELITETALKSGLGEYKLRRFFALISSIFAIKESQPTVPNTPTNMNEIIKELKQINTEYRYLEQLAEFNSAMSYVFMKELQKISGYYLLTVNRLRKEININYFKPSQIKQANKLYIEKELDRKNKNTYPVLIKAESFNILKNAYPNYFSSVSDFLIEVTEFLK